MFRVDSFDQFVALYKIHYHDQIKPLSGTLFSNSREQIRLFKETVSAGALTINQSMFYANSSLPFGGVGSSGLGKYHGKESFT